MNPFLDLLKVTWGNYREESYFYGFMPIIDKTIKLFLFFPVVQTGSQTSDVLNPHLYICIVIVDLL